MIKVRLFEDEGVGTDDLYYKVFLGEGCAEPGRIDIREIRSSSEVDGCHVIYFEGQNPSGWRYHTKILGVEHDSEKVPDRLYECAVKYARNLAKSRRFEFVDETERGKQESELGESARA